MSWLLHKVHARLFEKNQNWICIICGATGTGKSYSALRLGEAIDKRFSIDNCCFTAEEFLKLLNSGTLKRGSVVIFDEAGVGLPARQWYDICNKAINYVLQTFRRENIALIMTTPSLSFIDAQARILSHTHIDTIKVDRKSKQVITKIKEVQFNPQMGKIYYKYYNKGNSAITKSSIGKPSAEIIKAYEEKKKSYAKNLYDNALADVESVGQPSTEKTKKTTHEIVEEVLKNTQKFMQKYRGQNVISLSRVQAQFECSDRMCRTVKSYIEMNHSEVLKDIEEARPKERESKEDLVL